MMAEPAKKSFNNLIFRVHLIHRIAVSLGFALIIFLFFIRSKLDWLVIAMITWNVFAFAFILTNWFVFFNRTPEQMRTRARQEDGSRVFVFGVILISCFASMFAVLLLVLSQDTAGTPRIIYVPVSMGTMLLSWMMVHTTFCFHYAHLYYDDSEKDDSIHAGGWIFQRRDKKNRIILILFTSLL
ncbi:MAG TPA: DUF1345 domain-containing protein [Chitinophagaceae bacterium]|nr:DUF1345 domain-containing protein [Chitinophagaceae bacterium]